MSAVNETAIAEEALKAANAAAQEALPEFLRDQYFQYVCSGALLLMALVPIWVGAHRSVEDVVSKKKRDEVMSTKDAAMFPVIGSCALLGLYVLFRFFGKEYINYLLTAYFVALGLAALAQTCKPYATPFLPAAWDKHPWECSIPLPGFVSDEPLEISLTRADLVSAVVAAPPVVAYVLTKHWVANNLFALAFSVQAVEMINVGSFQTAALLLSGLFVYDIFWVFGTDVMVTVATKFDGPIKILFPKSLTHTPPQLSLLGLGDIVLPGVCLALLLRFDAHHARTASLAKGAKGSSKKNAFNPSLGYPKPYFLTGFSFYIAGLAVTMLVMHVFRAAQPALLYLSPAFLIASFATAAIRGEISELWNYSEEVEEEEVAEGKKGGKTSKKND